MILKICGITNQEDADAAMASGANAIGFNFYPRSPRYVTPERAAAIVTAPDVRRVGVFVNERRERVEEIGRAVSLDVAQLHGDEPAEAYPESLAVWKAARVEPGFDWRGIEDCPAEALVLDGPAGELYGGAGKSFNWKLVGVPTWRIVLAGGLDASNVAQAVALVRPWGVDACSRIESAPGKKDHKKMNEFLQAAKVALFSVSAVPDAGGHFGPYGGRYVPEVLMAPIEELEKAYLEAREDAAFQAELSDLLRNYAGRPTPLYFARRLSEQLGGARIWLKREDLLHTGAHKINNCLGQALLARRMGKRRIIAETGAGQHGVGTATVCALLGLECVVYMGEEDMRRQSLNVFRMRMLGAKVQAVTSGSRTLKDAISEAMRDWVTNVGTTHYLLGSVLGAHPYPMMVRDFHKIIGEEARRQILESAGRLPATVFACVGGGSNAIGIFHAFLPDEAVQLVGVEAGGRGERLGDHAARYQGGAPGVLQGAYSVVLQDADGQIALTHSVSAGLDYAMIGPEHAWLHDRKRAEYTAASDTAALEAARTLSRTEGIIPALESSHAVAEAIRRAPGAAGKIFIVNLSGRGDKDVDIYRENFPELDSK